MNKKNSGRLHTAESLAASIKRVERGIARLIDAYEDGLVDRGEFEPRIKRAKDRLAKREAEAKVHAEQETEEQQLRLVIGRLEEFAERVKGGLNETDWMTRRQIIRALVKRVEIDEESVRVVYRVAPAPSTNDPTGAIMQHCWRGDVTAAFESAVGRLGPGTGASRALLLPVRRRLQPAGRGWWRMAQSPAAHEAMTPAWFKSFGLVGLADRHAA
ncbi:MAG: hypothetical protein ACYTFA_05965 [Planctomycetota bacterium]|jgi:site-specific DNA recombinase